LLVVHCSLLVEMAAFTYPRPSPPAAVRLVSEKRSSYRDNLALSNVQEPIAKASPEVREIIERVLQAEKDKLYLDSPRNINDDILAIIKEVIQ